MSATAIHGRLTPTEQRERDEQHAQVIRQWEREKSRKRDK